MTTPGSAKKNCGIVLLPSKISRGGKIYIFFTYLGIALSKKTIMSPIFSKGRRIGFRGLKIISLDTHAED